MSYGGGDQGSNFSASGMHAGAGLAAGSSRSRCMKPAIT